MNPNIIAEIGINHEGSVDKAIALLEDIAANGLEYVKFQIYDPQYFDGDAAEPVFRKFWIDFTDYDTIIAKAKSLGLKWGASTFGDSATIYVLAQNPDFYKVSSRRAGDKALAQKLLKAGYTEKPVLVSHGMGAKRVETMRLWEALNARHLWCVSKYPVPPEEAKLHLLDAYGYDGYSDHTEGTSAMIVAGILGAEWIEKHVCLLEQMVELDCTGKAATPDICCSTTPELIHSAAIQIAHCRRYL